jgi:hypothetical protein
MCEPFEAGPFFIPTASSSQLDRSIVSKKSQIRHLSGIWRTMMKKLAMFILMAVVSLTALTPVSMAQSFNNEAVCTQLGYGMDPRCVGD